MRSLQEVIKVHCVRIPPGRRATPLQASRKNRATEARPSRRAGGGSSRFLFLLSTLGGTPRVFEGRGDVLRRTQPHQPKPSGRAAQTRARWTMRWFSPQRGLTRQSRANASRHPGFANAEYVLKAQRAVTSFTKRWRPFGPSSRVDAAQPRPAQGLAGAVELAPVGGKRAP